ncbi:MAG: hypothetical protein E2O85_01850 [Bacteroidetes bacterium]|nr:MAG: hypothetical protein E2O85_01850 [Bacteroidota bacterium]
MQESGIGDIDKLVDQLLRDEDYLLAKELKHKIDELNHLFIQAERQHLDVELKTSKMDVPSGGTVNWLELRILKEL